MSVWAAALLLTGLLGAAAQEDDIGALLNAADWGLPDATAVVGRLFSYPLQGEDVKVVEVGQSSLPSWLSLAGNRLVGVPTPEHANAQHHLEVSSSKPRDMFTLSVKADTPDTPLPVAADSELKPVRCSVGSSVTMASIIVDADLSSLAGERRAGLLERMAGHLNMPAELLRLLSAGNKPLVDSSALVAGPGDVKSQTSPGVIVQWEVGCGNVHADHMPLLQALESTAHDGRMSGAVGHGVLGWHVTNSKLQAQAHTRLKRQARIRPTLMPTAMPTAGPPTQQVVPTRVIPGETVVTRPVVVMSSPTFPGPVPTHTKKHKHRTKTKGRHNHHKTPKHSPKHEKTHMPTPTVMTIQPTRVVPTMEASSMVAPMVTPSMPMSPGPSRTTDDFIEPSITPPLAGTSSSTKVLPTTPLEAISTQPIEPTKAVTTTTASATTTPAQEFNYGPILKNGIQRLTVEVGDVFTYRVPKETFHDYEDGNTRKLKLVFLTVDGLSISRDSWVQFKQEEQRLYGLPLEKNKGRQEYLMAAIDSRGKIARDPFEILVVSRPLSKPINHELSLTFNLPYEHFINDVDQRVDIAKKIASIYGDPSSKYLTVTRIAKGSVVYAWTNNTLPVEPCPTREIAALVARLLTENNTIQPSVIEVMKPLEILKAGASRKGACSIGPPEDGKVESTLSEEVNKQPAHDNDVLITTVVPAVVIGAMLLLAALVGCMLYRKRRTGKLTTEDQQTFINKGIPIIFADELEEKQPDPSSKPLIMADEKPPLPPPEYPRGGGGAGSQPSTPGSQHKEPLIDTEEEELGGSPPYQRPPPLSGSGHSRGGPRSAGSQPYRSNQPYVQP